jgi:hypothetical protein
VVDPNESLPAVRIEAFADDFAYLTRLTWKSVWAVRVDDYKSEEG